MVGGGDFVCEEVVYFIKYGSYVYLVVCFDKFCVSVVMVDWVLVNDLIMVYWNSEIEDVSGDDWM